MNERCLQTEEAPQIPSGINIKKSHLEISKMVKIKDETARKKRHRIAYRRGIQLTTDDFSETMAASRKWSLQWKKKHYQPQILCPTERSFKHKGKIDTLKIRIGPIRLVLQSFLGWKENGYQLG